MKSIQILFSFLSIFFLTSQVCTQTPLSEIQGQATVSPFEGEVVTVEGKVTEYFGDTWYLQDDYGAWNGLYCVGPDVLVAANPPYWSSPRQPVVGDVLQLTGTIVEQDGNTQLVEITDFVHVDFWNATAMGTAVSISEMADESLEGTRVRFEDVTVVSAPDEYGYWTVSDDTGETAVFGVDTDDAGNNEDADGPTAGDRYRVYGALRQVGETYQLDVGDIDTLALAVGVAEAFPAQRWTVFPNPGVDWISFGENGVRGTWEVFDLLGRKVASGDMIGLMRLDVTGWQRGSLVLFWEAEHVSGSVKFTLR